VLTGCFDLALPLYTAGPDASWVQTLEQTPNAGIAPIISKRHNKPWQVIFKDILSVVAKGMPVTPSILEYQMMTCSLARHTTFTE
jgi:hypothetical protein